VIAEEVSDLREDWMTCADEVLADEESVSIEYDALTKRHPKSCSRGRRREGRYLLRTRPCDEDPAKLWKF
jgi:hypothetical protein